MQKAPHKFKLHVYIVVGDILSTTTRQLTTKLSKQNNILQS